MEEITPKPEPTSSELNGGNSAEQTIESSTLPEISSSGNNSGPEEGSNQPISGKEDVGNELDDTSREQEDPKQTISGKEEIGNELDDTSREQEVSETNSVSVPAALAAKKENLKVKKGVSVVPIIGGIIITVLFFFILPAFPKGSFFNRLFLPEGTPTLLSTGVPLLATFFFWWSMIDILLISGKTRKEIKPLFLNRFVLATGNNNFTSIEQLNREWKGTKKGRTFDRIYSLTEVLESTHDTQRGYEFFRYQSDLESEKAISKYNLTKIAIWAMPILGFIGTVLGIGIAIGHFATFLNQKDVEDVVAVKQELSNVAIGLSFAFYSTLFGLVLSMIMMFVSTYIQNTEERYLTQLEEVCFSIIQKFKGQEIIQPETMPTSVSASSPMDDILVRFNEALDNKVNGVSDKMDALIKQFESSSNAISERFTKLPDLEAFNNQFASSVKSAFTKIDETVKNISTNVESLGKALENSSKKVSAEFERIPIFLAKSNQEFELSIAKASASFAGIINHFNSLANNVAERIAGLGAHFDSSATVISGALDKIPVKLEETDKQFIETINLITERLEAMKIEFSTLSDQSEKFYNADLGPVLMEMKETQKSLIPILEKLTKPTEIVFSYGKDNNLGVS